MKLERDFQPDLIEELEELLPGCFIIKNDANAMPGIPDLLILWRKHWALLETKRVTKSRKRPNQDFYIDVLNDMSFAAFVNQENKEEVLDALQQSFGLSRNARVLKR